MSDAHATLFDESTTHRAEQEHGPCFDGKRLRWLSASILTMADPASPAGCLRRLFYAKVEKRSEPTSDAMATGTAGHGRIERYLRTGEKVLDMTELAGARFIYEPDPANMIEASIAGWGLTAADTPLVGNIDLLKHGRRYIREDGEEGWDPQGTVEVVDWKFRGNLVNSVNGPALANTVQMVTYGEAAARKFDAPYVRLSHVNFQTKGRREARKTTVLVRRADLSKRWNTVEVLARSIQRAVACKSPEDVEPNTNACGAYRGCPHRNYCTAGRQSVVDEIFGVTAANHIGESMSTNLLGLLNLQPATAVAPNVNPPRVLFPDERAALAPVAPTGPTAEEIAVERTRLEAEAHEAQRAAAAAARAAAGTEGVREAWGAIAAAGRGLPGLSGDAFRAWSVATSDVIPQPDAVRPGEGQLGAITLTHPSQFAQLCTELGVAVPAPVLPPDAPPSDPAQAAAPVEGFSDPTAVAAYAEKAKRGRPRKVKPVDAPVMIPAAVVPSLPVLHSDPPLVTAQATVAAGPTLPDPPMHVNGVITGLMVYVDAMPNCPAQSLDAYADQIAATICKEYGIADVRLGADNSPLGYGKWKGALAAVARKYPPPAGVYVTTSGSEVAREVAIGLAPCCAPGCWTRGAAR